MADIEPGRPIYRECRACLKIGESSGFIDIFLGKEPPWCKDTTIAEELARIAHVEVSDTDKCSDVVCFGCCFKLHTAAQFITMVQQSDKIIKARHHNLSTNNNKWPKPIQLETEVSKAVLGNVPEVEIKKEVLSEEENGQSESTDGGDKPDFYMEIKVEPEEIVQSAPIQVMVNGTITADQMKQMSNGGEIYYDEEYLNEDIKDEPISDEESGPFDLPLECMLCAKNFLSVSGLKAHVVACHSYKSVRRRHDADRSPAKPRRRYICSICRKCFWTLTDLMVHETCHNKFHCYGCQMTFYSFGDLLKHRQRCVASNTQQHQVKTLKDAVRSTPTEVNKRKSYDIKCSKCNENFTNEYYMNVHNKVCHSLSNSETDKVLCKTEENENVEADKKEKRKETISVGAEEIYRKKETACIEADKKDDIKEDTSVVADEKDKRKETTRIEAEQKNSNKMEIESLELEMQQIHEGSYSGCSKNDSKANIESPTTDQGNEPANAKIETDKSLNKVEEPDKIKEIVIEVNGKNVTDSNNRKEKNERSKETTQEPEPLDNKTNCAKIQNESDDHTSKLAYSESVEAHKSVIEINTVESLKDNTKEEIHDTFACSMMKMDSY